MVSKEEFNKAMTDRLKAQETISAYMKEQEELFQKRLNEGPAFNDDELVYSHHCFCPCGHGLAYPRGCGIQHYWDCSVILKGIADKKAKHTGKLPFAFYNVRAESVDGTTRGVFKPQERKE